MIEYIGKKIQEALSGIEYISLAGGYAEMIEAPNKEGERARRPMCRKYTNGVATDYVELTPDGSESCITFVDSQNDVSVETHTSRYDILIIRPRVVAWYDERKLIFEGEADTGTRIFQDVQSAIKAINFSFFAKSTIRFESVAVDPARIWGAYNFKPDDALFMAPYRTIAFTFRMKVWLTACKESKIELDTSCC